MLNEKAYYEYLYQRFVKKHETEFETALLHKRKMMERMQMNTKEIKTLLQLLNEIERKYEFNMYEQCRVNFVLLTLWQKQLGIKKSNNFLYAALKFILGCCLGDKILDSRRFNDEKKQILDKKLSLNYIRHCYDGNEIDFPEVDQLLQESVGWFLKEDISFGETISVKADHNKNMILETIEKAFISEQYSWRLKLGDCQWRKHLENAEVLLSDKSIEFEKGALLLCGVGYISAESIYAAQLIGEICWLADDLFDFVDDIKCDRINSLLYELDKNKLDSCQGAECNIEKRIDMVFENLDFFILELENRLDQLRKCVNDDLYYFVMCMVWEWSASVRRK